MTTHVTSAAELENHKTNDVLNIIGLVILITAFVTILLWVFGLIGPTKLAQIEGVLLLFWAVVKYLNTPKSSPKDLVGSSKNQVAQLASEKGSNQGEVLMYFFFLFIIYMFITIMLTKLVITQVLRVDRLGLNEFNLFLVNMAGVVLNISLAIMWIRNSFTFNKAKAANIYQLVISGDMVECGKNLRPLPLVGVCLISPFKGAVEGNTIEYREKNRFLTQRPGKIGKKEEDGQPINIKHKKATKSIPRIVKWYCQWTIGNTMLYELTEYGKESLPEEERRVDSMVFSILESVLHEANCEHVEEYEPIKGDLSDKVFSRLVEAMGPIGLRPVSFTLKSVERTADEEQSQIERNVEITQGQGLSDVAKIVRQIPGMTDTMAATLAATITGEVETRRTEASINQDDDTSSKRKRRKKGRDTDIVAAYTRAEAFEAAQDDGGGNGHNHNHGNGGD